VRSRLVLVLAAGVAAASLAGCSGQSPEPEPEETTAAAAECTASGEASDSVEVTGELGSKPEVTIDAPLEFSETQRTVIVEGEGEQAEADDSVRAELTMYNAETGAEIVSTGHDGSQPVDVSLDGTWPAGITKALTCLAEGGRAVVAVTAEDGYGDAGNPQAGIEPGTPLVIVADRVAIPAPPSPQPWDSVVPEVEFESDGTPTVTIPDADPPTEFRLTVLEEGTGPVVEDGATVSVFYHGTSWDTKEVFDENWGQEPAQFSTGGVIPGFRGALVGQKVGSTIIATIPPDLAYGPEGSGSELAGQTLVFLVKIEAAE
jgi:FKBP-type peptidyl-prolyl cis-trans isomerase